MNDVCRSLEHTEECLIVPVPNFEQIMQAELLELKARRILLYQRLALEVSRTTGDETGSVSRTWSTVVVTLSFGGKFKKLLASPLTKRFPTAGQPP